ncbi:MAG TPA: NADH-quinone oxidoreductase subunit L [Planctomycetes bacterium]|nr:NADH-quinone oxidoreductase subunit L [Planctomycetota bacterium]
MQIDWGSFGDGEIGMMVALLLLPLLGFGIQIFVGKRLPRQGDFVPTLAIFGSLVLAILLFVGTMTQFDPKLLMHSGHPDVGMRGLSWNWLGGGKEGNFVFAFLFDNLTAVMLLVVTLVSFLVHVFSIGYMKGDSRYSRFFAYLGIFSFSMLGLVLTSNFLFLLLFWELVGLSSYLLIGFWFEKTSAADACKKAFLTTRVGDLGMLLGMMLIWSHFKTFDFLEIFDKAAAEVHANGGVAPGWMTLAGLLVFMGPVGKSAQLPLHIWLPDAMEGPTPVSALIHAATMVAAGVYLVGRLFPFFLFLPDALLVIALVGALTAFVAATIGITQFDIKKVLAYSTVSQLGFMMTALGCGALGAGMMHLMTHAWFKACLFLCSGSVIHGMHHEQDMRQMGGLRKKMPITYLAMLISTLAIAGFPFFSGFYSKDAIVAATMHPQPGYEAVLGDVHGFLWMLPRILIPLAALMTAFYMFRLIFMTFHGEPQSDKARNAHESPFSITFPLVVLSAMAIFGASPWIFNGDLLGHHIWFDSLIKNPGFDPEAGKILVAGSPEAEAHGLAPLVTSLIVAFSGILLAFLFYFWKVLNPAKVVQALGPVYTTIYNKYYFDEFYLKFIVRPLVYQWNVFCAAFDKFVIDGFVNGVGRATTSLSFKSGWFDKNIVDGFVNFLAFVTQVLGAISRLFQTGSLPNYMNFMVGSGLLGFIVYFFFL